MSTPHEHGRADDMRPDVEYAAETPVTRAMLRGTLDYEDAIALQASYEQHPEKVAVLLPTVASILTDDAEHGPAALAGMRTLVESIGAAVQKAIVSDLARDVHPDDLADSDGEDDEDEHEHEHHPTFVGTAQGIEDALMEVYGGSPRALARVLMQAVIDDTTMRMFPAQPDPDAAASASGAEVRAAAEARKEAQEHARLAQGVAPHPFHNPDGRFSATCTQMVERDGGGDQCGLPAWHPLHDDPYEGQDFDEAQR